MTPGALVLQAIRRAAAAAGRAEVAPPAQWPDAPAGGRLLAALAAWAGQCPLPLVFVLRRDRRTAGESLRSVLRHLRDGYTARPEPFPHSVALCGLRDVRDNKVAAGGDPSRLGTAGPFNIKVKSLRVGDFTVEEVRELFRQHTEETGQPFTGQATASAYECTEGQPWLVNALAREITYEMRIAPPTPITAEHVEQAKERLILARATHLDSLAAKLA